MNACGNFSIALSLPLVSAAAPGEGLDTLTLLSRINSHRSGECMKYLLLVPVFLVLQISLLAQDAPPAAESKVAAGSNQVTDPQTTPSPKPASSADRMFFPKDWYWGWAQFDLAPPHNEVDPNLCAANAGPIRRQERPVQCICALHDFRDDGAAPDRPDVSARRDVLLRSDVPLRQECAAVSLHLVVERDWNGVRLGRGVDLPKRFEVRFTGHPAIQRFGARDQPLGPAWLGSNGPWGQYNTIGVRKYFGTRREGTY